MGADPAADATRLVVERLEEARALGFLGPGRVADHIAHAEALAAFAGSPAGPVLDLGAGGGVPGLVLAVRWPAARLVLLDAHRRRCGFLEDAVQGLGWSDRVEVVEGRAEVEARDPRRRARFDLVTARGFGAPAVTAESAVGFLGSAGRLVVTEPPDERAERWPEHGLERLGLELVRVERVGPGRFAELRRRGALDERWPRRTGIPAKRPLW